MRHADGSYRWVKTSGRVVARDCAGKATRVVGVRMDITQSKQSTQQLACANDALRAVNRTLNVVVECNQALVRATTEQQLLDEMCRILVQRGDHLLAWVGMARRDAGKSVSVTASHGATRYLESLDTTWGDDALGQGPTGGGIARALGAGGAWT
jgi:hypothetical protein